jgi:hypothetical protein
MSLKPMNDAPRNDKLKAFKPKLTTAYHVPIKSKEKT